jgi:hypothetical protein
MGMKTVVAVLPMTLFALACGGHSKQEKSTALSDDLRSDLARASAPTSALASSQFRPQQVVSNIELGNAPAARETHSPSKASRSHTRRTPRAKPAPAPKVEAVKAVTVEPAAQPTTIAVVPAPEPTAGPRPTPNPVEYPSGGGSDTDGEHAGGGIGGVIGVIIRGGSIGDDDHCEIHPGVPVMVNSRIPVPIGRGTFPRPRGGW